MLANLIFKLIVLTWVREIARLHARNFLEGFTGKKKLKKIRGPCQGPDNTKTKNIDA